jgi:PAS domain S-box-containing protein
MQYRFEDLVDLNQLHGLLHTFFEVTGVASALIDPAGNILRTKDGDIVGGGWRRICLDFHRANPRSAARCTRSDIELSMIMSPGRLACRTCPNGLVDAARPVVIGGHHLVSLFTGQFLFEPPNLHVFRQQAKEFGFDEAEYLEALKEVPVFSKEFVDKTLIFLDQVAKTIAEMGLKQMKLLDLNHELRGGLAEAQHVAGLGSWVMNFEDDRLIWSDEMYRIFGLSREAFDGMYRSFLEAIYPEDRDAVHEAYTASLVEGGRYDIEYRILRPSDGLVRWGYARCEHERDVNGKVLRSVGTVLDITDRKEAKLSLELMNRELGHRVGNLLAVAQAIISLTDEASLSTAEFRDSILGRLHALHKSVGLINREDWKGVWLHELSKAEFAPVADRIEVSGHDVLLKSRAAQSLSLLFYEMMTNSSKHGALSERGGTVTAEWEIKDAGSGPLFYFRWQEHGHGIAEPPTRQGFGMKLLTRLVPSDLGGRATLNFEPSGFKYELEASVERVVEQDGRAATNVKAAVA